MQTIRKITVATILIAFFSLLLLGCNNTDEPYVSHKNQYKIICIDGVAYVQWGHGISVKLHADGKPYICVDTDTRVIVK